MKVTIETLTGTPQEIAEYKKLKKDATIGKVKQVVPKTTDTDDPALNSVYHYVAAELQDEVAKWVKRMQKLPGVTIDTREGGIAKQLRVRSANEKRVVAFIYLGKTLRIDWYMAKSDATEFSNIYADEFKVKPSASTGHWGESRLLTTKDRSVSRKVMQWTTDNE